MNTENCIFADALLRNGALFFFGLAALGLVAWAWVKSDKIEDCIGLVYKIMPIATVFFCVWFFVHAFEVTHKVPHPLCKCQEYACLHKSFNEDGSNSVLVASVDKLTKSVQEKIAQVSSLEHDQFRAELGTWLSIFGLLSIIATLVVPVATYKAQQGALEKKVKELEKRYNEQKSRSDVIQSQIDKQTAESNEVVEFVQAASEKRSDEYLQILSEYRVRKSNLLTSEIRLLSKQDMQKRVDEIIRLLLDVSGNVLEKSLGTESVRLALNLVNNTNCFLATSIARESGFSQMFLKKLRDVQPLRLSPDEIAEKLVGLSENLLPIYKGYYESMYDKQKE